MGDEENDGPSRYYASDNEQQVLVNGLRQYFSYPERSTTRNKIAAQVTAYLQCFSPHWNHRAVRLWFNNNKKTFLPDEMLKNSPAIINPPESEKENPMQVTNQQFPSIKDSMNKGLFGKSNQIPENTFPSAMMNSTYHTFNQSNFAGEKNLMPGLLNPMNSQSNSPSKNPQTQIISGPLLQNIQGNDTAPSRSLDLQIPKQFHAQPSNVPQKQVQSMNIIPTDTNIKQLASGKSIGQNHPQSQLVMPPIRPPSPKVQFGSVTGKNIGNNQIKKQTGNYAKLNSIIKEIKNLKQNEGNSQVDKLRDDFDNTCRSISSEDGSCNPEKIDFMVPPIRIKMSQDSADNIFYSSMYDSIPSAKISSFLDSTDSIMRPSTPDLLKPRTKWSEKKYEEKKLIAFEKVSIHGSKAAYLACDILTSVDYVAVTNINDDNEGWDKYNVGIEKSYNSFIVGDKYSWCCSDKNIYRTNVTTSEKSLVIPFPKEKVKGLSLLSHFGSDTALIGFTQSGSLFLSNHEFTELGQTKYPGFTAVYGFHKDILCVPGDSYSIRRIDVDSREICSYVGHCNYVREIFSSSEKTFISRSDDSTIRLWDVRSPLPQIQINCNGSAISQDDNYIVFGMASKGISVIDIRDSKIKLCVPTQDYLVESLMLNSQRNELVMFGMISHEMGKDSMIFIESDGRSRKRIFRKYPSFITL